jgi:dihydrolipoamide dehydrogenase
VAKYDLAIIGSGPGGYVTAIRGAQWGLKTVVVEKDGFLGGTCLHVGCIPTKVLLHHAEIYDQFKNAQEFGIRVREYRLDWSAVLARKDKIVKKHAKGIEFLFRKNKIETIQGWGRIAGPGKVAVERDGKVLELAATNTLLATGSEARSLPGVHIDAKAILTNKEILSLQEIPKSLIVIGAGAVGVEFASIYNSFGSEVTILEMLPRVVPLALIVPAAVAEPAAVVAAGALVAAERVAFPITTVAGRTSGVGVGAGVEPPQAARSAATAELAVPARN